MFGQKSFYEKQIFGGEMPAQFLKDYITFGDVTFDG